MATEDRWHDFAKEKPSEDMEGRNFIVSNGHYEKIATWCGYWENEPFMGDRLCDEVVRWKFYFTPEEEKANRATCNELKAINLNSMGCYNINEPIYLKSEADKVIAHHKHKRCLAMAEWCNANCMHTVLLIGHKIMPHWEWRIKTNYWYKWRKIWLELAEKFKEEK